MPQFFLVRRLTSTDQPAVPFTTWATAPFLHVGTLPGNHRVALVTEL